MTDNFNSSGTATGAANPYSAPKTDLSEQRAPDEAELAGRGRRLGAAIIDTIIMVIVAVGPIIMLSGGWTAYSLKAAEGSIGFILMNAIVGLVIYLLINGYFLAKDGQSVGKKVLGIKIVRTDGSKADFARIVLRRLLPVQVVSNIPMIGPLLALVDVLLIFRASKKCVHDDIADTVVIRI
jgi:uncharacterized RDD family membrane protein YckC